jgi:hypothetical protein
MKMIGGEGGIRFSDLFHCFQTSHFSDLANRAPCPAPKIFGFMRTNMDQNCNAIDDTALAAVDPIVLKNPALRLGLTRA